MKRYPQKLYVALRTPANNSLFKCDPRLTLTHFTVMSNRTLHFERKDRAESGNSTSTNGGGILIYLSNHINYVRRHDLECSNIESIWIEIKIRNSKPFLLCSVYRPPSSPAEWYDYFSTQIDKSHAITEEIYIMGDLNVNVDSQNATLTCIKWKHITELYDLHQLIQEPTRITAHSSTLIDHLYVSTPENVTESFAQKLQSAITPDDLYS